MERKSNRREMIAKKPIFSHNRVPNHMKTKKRLIGIAVIAVVIISLTAFSISQAITHPTDLSIIKQGNQNDYLVNGTPYVTTNLTLNNANLTLYLQLITPGGNVPNDTPFLIEVNAFITSNDSTSNHIMINLTINGAHLDQTSIPIGDSSHSVLNGTILQSVYHSVSTNEPITNSTQFSANVSVQFFESLGPYYYSVHTVNLLI